MTTLNRRQFVLGAGMTAVGSAIGGSFPVSGQTSENTGDDSPPSLIAHRGFAGVYPENTVRAARLASRSGGLGGADMIEIDIVPTADGDVVVFHDDRLAGRDGGDRGLTDASGIVWETPTEEVLIAEVLESGETVPLLGDVLDAIPPHVGVNVEFKNPGSSDLRFAQALSPESLKQQKEIWRPFTERALAIISNHTNPILISSFYEAALATVRDCDSSLPVAFLFWDSIEDGLTVTRRHDCEAVHPPWNMIQNTPFFGDEYYTSGPFADIDLVEVAHAEQRSVHVYTVGTWYQADQLAIAGVDGLIADYPSLLAHSSHPNQ